MFASGGFAIFTFSLTVMTASLVAMMFGWRWAAVRAGAMRLLVVFAIFAAAGFYVWSEVGPAVDYRTQVNENPTLPLPAPKYYWI
jgi:hypothetical protein